MTEDNPSFILTHSQELQLLSDQDVGSMMHLLNTELEPAEEYYSYQEFDHTLGSDDSNQTLLTENYEPTTSPEVSVSLQPEAPVAPCIISNDDYSGPLEFEVSIKPQAGNSNSVVYSEKLNKVYTMISNSIPVDFKWKTTSKSMFVRATPLYSSTQHAQELVKRCLPHSSPAEPSNASIPYDLFDHVLRCQSPTAFYCGSVEAKMFLNVIVPLGQPQAGTDSVRLMYSFVCNNSCPSGMNRKALEVVFTLEDETGKVFGRKKVAARVCSCPKRDKEKEEKDCVKVPSKGKKFKTEKKPYSYTTTSLDTTEYSLHLNICGKQNRNRLARVAYEIITTQIADHGPNPALKANQEQLLALLRSLD